MSPKEFAEVASALAWPCVALAALIGFSNPLHALLERLAATLTIKVVKLKAFGAEVELTSEQAKRALDELLQDIADSTNELTAVESSLFERIIRSGGKESVEAIFPGFQRDSEEHRQLGRLRDRKLIRPFESGRWQGPKHPVVTRFGQLVYELKSAPKSAG